MNRHTVLAAIDAETYREVCSHFCTGVAVATVRAADASPHGLTVSTFTPVSLDPPLVLICIDLACTVARHFMAATHFAINVLTDAQRELSVGFAAKPEGRFEGVAWRPGATGAPLLEGSLATLECTLQRVMEVGDHAVVVGLIVSAASYSGEPLLYYKRAYRTLL
jgi:flavin reductase (DIM6/NTAB) family NADH-FMN oxidoreductase RutF